MSRNRTLNMFARQCTLLLPDFAPAIVVANSFHRPRLLSSSNLIQPSMKAYRLKGVGHQTSVTMTTHSEYDNQQSHKIRTDLPVPIGSNSGAQPVEHLLTAYAGCTQATAQFVARNMKLTTTDGKSQKGFIIHKMEFDICGIRNENGALSNLPIHKESNLPDDPSRLTLIEGTIRVFAALKQKIRLGEMKESSKDTTKKRSKWTHVHTPIPIHKEHMIVLERHTEARCPVANMIIASGCHLKVTWEDGYDEKSDYTSIGTQ